MLTETMDDVLQATQAKDAQWSDIRMKAQQALWEATAHGRALGEPKSKVYGPYTGFIFRIGMFMQKQLADQGFGPYEAAIFMNAYDVGLVTITDTRRTGNDGTAEGKWSCKIHPPALQEAA